MTTSDLPANVNAVPDRHGKLRYRFRRKGWKSAYLKGEPGTAKFHESYAAILKRGPRTLEQVESPTPVTPRSLDDLFNQLKKTMRWKKHKPQTQRVKAGVIQRFLDRHDKKNRRYGARPVAKVTVIWLDKVLASMSETPAAANVLRKNLSGMFDTAIRLGWRTDNPARLTETYQEGEGFHTWTEEEIAQFRKHHALGTMARLTLELALNTAARRCNVATLTRDAIVDGRILIDHAKGNNDASVPMLPTTRAALDALPAAPIKHLITNIYGKPFSVAGLGNKMRKWCDDAGLKGCSLHGLRKATSRRIAESGGTDAEGQAITGHKKAQTFIKYRERANRAHLADAALSNLASKFDVQPEEKG